MTLLQDPHPDVRRTAALSLGKIAESTSIPALVRSLNNDTDAQVREYSAWAIGTKWHQVIGQCRVSLGHGFRRRDP